MKIAVILSGGAMRAAFCVGALLELHRKGIKPSIVIAGSGSAPTGAYFVSNQIESIPFVWENLLSNKRFINIARLKNIINIDYLIDNILKRQEVLNSEGVSASSIEYLIPATNFVTGEVQYFSNKNEDFDVFESMRATMAYPLLSGGAVSFNGESYCDGVFSSSPFFHIKKAKELGAKKIIIIDSGVRTNRFLYKFWLRFKSKEFRKNQLGYFNVDYITNEVTVIKPLKKINSSILDTRKSTVVSLIKKGRESARVIFDSFVL